MAKHRGKFKWKQHSKYSGNLREYWWEHPDRPDNTRHRKKTMTNYKITMEAQSEIRPEDIGGLLDYLLGGALRITFLAVDKIGSDDS